MKDPLLWLLMAALVLLAFFHPSGWSGALHAIHIPTLETLTGLMILTQGIEHSCFLEWFGQRLMRFATHERALARWLTGFSALLATLLTNDITLFIVVPLTVSLRASGVVSWRRLIIMEALAANVGASLSPIGSPQNIYLWQTSHLSLSAFIQMMASWVLGLGFALIVAIELTFPKQPLPRLVNASPAFDRRLFWISLALYLPFLVALEMDHPTLALGLTLPLTLLHRPLLNRIDWGILAIFTLFFVDIGWLTGVVHAQQLPGLAHPSSLIRLGWGALLSQVFSNVPATLFLNHAGQDTRALAYGVNAGGFGFWIGSLANLIALRLAKDRKIWGEFHRFSFPFLVYALVTAVLLL